MKQLVGHDVGGYVFNPIAKTITFIGVPAISLDQILTITNTTDGLMIYCFADPGLVGTLANNILTLAYDTSSMSASDSLQIYLDIPSTVVVDQAAMNDNYTHLLLERIADLLEPIATQDVANRQRIAIDAISGGLTLATLSTISNAVPVGNVATLGLVDPRYLFIDTARNAYAQGIRSNLAFS